MRVNKKLHPYQGVKHMTQSGKGGNGHQEYNPGAEFEHVTADVWYEKDTETGERTDVTYSQDILDQMEEDNSDEEDESSSE